MKLRQLNPEARRPACVLGIAGLMPFVGLTVAMFAGNLPHERVAQVLLAYGAVIVSFVGALHWGLAMRDLAMSRYELWKALGWGVLPALAAWVALLLPPADGLWLLCATMPVCWWMDQRLARTRMLDAWYLQLRTLLSVVATPCLALSALALG